MNRMQASIQRSTATALESERIGTEVIEDLNYQRERLTGARDRLHDANTGAFYIVYISYSVLLYYTIMVFDINRKRN